MAALTTTSKRLGSSAVTVSEAGVSWSYPSNVLSKFTSYSYATATKTKYSEPLLITDFKFDIPANANILGVTVQKYAKADAVNKVYDRTMYLYNNGIVGSNYATADYYSTGATTRTYGGAADTWGITLTPSDVNSSDFGVSLSMNMTDEDRVATIYWVDIEITYEYAEVIYTRVSSPVSLSSVTEVKDSSIRWTSVEPTYTDVKIYSALSTRDSVAPMGYALDLDGSNAAMITPSSEFTTEMTACAWIKPTSLEAGENNNAAIISRYYDASGTTEYCWDLCFDIYGSNIIRMRVENSTGTLVTAYGPSALTDSNKWYNVAGVYDGSNVTVYIDGIPGTPVALTGTIVSRTTRQIGIGSIVPYSFGVRFKGYIDEVNLWSVALTQEEIQTNMYRELDDVGSGEGLECYLKCDEYNYISGETYPFLIDETGNNTVIFYYASLAISGAGWYEQTSGNVVANYTVGDDLSDKYFWCKQELMHQDDSVTPELGSITVSFYMDLTESIEISINGDITTYNSVEEAIGGGYILGGIPSSGAYALSAKASGSYVKYTETYDAGTLWALTYNNLTSDLDDLSLSLPSVYTGEVIYLDKRYGRIILSEPVSSPLTNNIYCTSDYTFKTLQATGIEINQKTFREREIDNRFKAIDFLRKYLAPNYIIRTIGDDKVWASYLTQKTTADYNLTLATSLSYLEDEDLYTRVKMWTKNENPNNVMFGEDVDYEVDDLDAYTGIATKEELMYIGDEKSGILSEVAQSYLTEAEQFEGTDPTVEVIKYLSNKYISKEYPSQPTNGYRIYATPISNEYGKIILDEITPVIWLNGIPIDNKVHRIDSVPVKIRQKVQTITEGGGKSKSASTYTYYYYSIIFPHTSIEPTQPIRLYDLQGALQYTIQANDPNMDYGSGVLTLPGIEQNDIVETISTAGYDVLYDSSLLEIDYEDVVFKLEKGLVPNPDELVVRATFEYWSIAVGVRDIRAVVDGRRDTQLQLQFFGAPISGFHLTTIDMGAIYNVQAVDLIGGFYKPDEYRKFDVDFTVSMQYSTNGTDFYSISDATEQVRVTGGEAITFQEEDLGIGFEARYLKFNLYDVARIEYGRGRYVVALTEISVYNDIVLESEATLIPTTSLAQAYYGQSSELLDNAHLENWTGDVPNDWDVIGANVSKETVEVYTGSTASAKIINDYLGRKDETNKHVSVSALTVYQGTHFTPTSNITVNGMWGYVRSISGDGYGQIRLSSEGSFGTLIKQSVQVPFIAPAPSYYASWTYFEFSSPVTLTSGTPYFLCLYSSHSGGGTGLFYADASGVNSWTNINGFWTQYTNREYLIYAVEVNEISQTLTTTDYNERTVTLTGWVKSDESDSARIGIITNDDSSYSSYHTGSGDWEQLSVSLELATTTTSITVQTDTVSISGPHYFDWFSFIVECNDSMYLTDTSGFSLPESAETVTAYLDKSVAFTYTGIESGNVLTGCVAPAGTSESAGVTVTQEIAGDTSLYDEDHLLPKLGDRLSKLNFISDRNLYNEEETNALAKAYLIEYYKDHTKAKVSVMYSPYLQVGQTISVTDTYNNISSVNYFIEAISERSGGTTTLTLARYPST